MYNFEGIEKDLQKKTFAREERAKEVAGITSDSLKKIKALSVRFAELSRAFDAEKDDGKKSELMTQMLDTNDETAELQDSIGWYHDFNKALAVMDVMLVGGSAGLTKDNFGSADAEQVWKDFFTQTSKIKLTTLPVK